MGQAKRVSGVVKLSRNYKLDCVDWQRQGGHEKASAWKRKQKLQKLPRRNLGGRSPSIKQVTNYKKRPRQIKHTTKYYFIYPLMQTYTHTVRVKWHGTPNTHLENWALYNTTCSALSTSISSFFWIYTKLYHFRLVLMGKENEQAPLLVLHTTLPFASIVELHSDRQKLCEHYCII